MVQSGFLRIADILVWRGCTIFCVVLRGSRLLNDWVSRRSILFLLSFPRVLYALFVMFFYSSCILWQLYRIFDVSQNEEGDAKAPLQIQEPFPPMRPTALVVRTRTNSSSA